MLTPAQAKRLVSSGTIMLISGWLQNRRCRSSSSSARQQSQCLNSKCTVDERLLFCVQLIEFLLESYQQQSVGHLQLTVNSAMPEAAISSLLISCLTLSPFLCRSRLENTSRFIKLQIMINAQIGGYVLLKLAMHLFWCAFALQWMRIDKGISAWNRIGIMPIWKI